MLAQVKYVVPKEPVSDAFVVEDFVKEDCGFDQLMFAIVADGSAF